MKKKLFTLVLILSINTPLFASYKEAVKLFEEKEYKNSLKILADELIVADDMNSDSPNYDLRFLAAHNHWKLGNTKSAISHFKRCMDIKKDNVDPYIELSLLQIELKRYKDAKKTTKSGLEIKKSPMLYYLLGIISLKRKNYWRAKELFEKANSMNPELYYSYNALGIALMKLKKYSEANTAFSVALAMRSESTEILNNLGMSLEKLGKNREAYEHYKKANSLDDENKIILENMIRVKKEITD